MSERKRVNRGIPIAAVFGVLMLIVAACTAPGGSSGLGAQTTTTYRIGPFNVAAGQSFSQVLNDIPRPAGQLGLQTSEFDVVDAAGNPVPMDSIMLHHIVLASNARSDALCPSRAERFSGSGNERAKLEVPDPYAYIVGPADRWGAILELMNMSTTDTQVYVQYRIGYRPGATAANMTPVTPYYVDVAQCGSSFDVPGGGGPGSVFTKTRPLTLPFDATIVSGVGHLHDGGIDVSVTNQATGATLCTSTAAYGPMGPGGEPMITAMSGCPPLQAVGSGDVLQVSARYDNSQSRSNVMGVLFAYVRRDS